MLPYHSLPLAVIGVSGACFASAPLAYVLLYAGVQYAVAFVCAMATTGVGLLGKREDGAMPLWSYAVFWPLHAAKAVFKVGIPALNCCSAVARKERGIRAMDVGVPALQCGSPGWGHNQSRFWMGVGWDVIRTVWKELQISWTLCDPPCAPSQPSTDHCFLTAVFVAKTCL